VENLRTIEETCRQQGWNMLEFLTQCRTAALRELLPESLIPHLIG
jgi:hypothetical protein